MHFTCVLHAFHAFEQIEQQISIFRQDHVALS
nr:MAG TPA: hypothetical protein [Caudoviricetes sp.]